MNNVLAALQASRLEKERVPDKTALAIEGTEVTATSPEGKSATMPVEAFLTKVAARRMDTGGAVLPDGVKAVITEGAITIWIYERPPCVQRFDWIAPDSPVPFGRGATYRQVRLALPYLIIFAVFVADPGGKLQLTGFNECFFRVEPLKSLADPLLFPGLLNCSRFEPPAGRPLSWICTQHLKPTEGMRHPDLSRRLTASFEALRHCLLETGFNLSSEHHEFSSWFTESQKVDPRVQTVEAWERESTKDPLFALEVPWIPAQHTVQEVAARIFKNQQAQARAPYNAATLARFVFNYQPAPPPAAP